MAKADAAKKEALEEAKNRVTGMADELQRDAEAEKQREAEVARASAYAAKVAQDAASPAASGGASPAGAPAVPAFPECEAELKCSIGEGPNHSNHSNHSNSFKIGIFRNFF